ncbi:metallophosphoesterase [Reichenbachiella carrageenanivorans]|uniref:acid phosphatase n=1 Tax=Reichenbachiella carrageenanivorans TaxID=2979869 RepID=A0ABY6CVK5_9BACT|nr:metallophosphoesterase [Reichenbachiella carrageenanivorans]UXX77935.1 metallophosphoesterase [Reichenbachiella carrageenanivorans]
MKKEIVYLSIFALLLTLGCFTNKGNIEINETKVSSVSDVEVLDGALNWYVIGDFGRNGYDGQQELADQMQVMTKVIEPEFIITTGDNFYPDGVASTQDPYWISSFENVYSGFGLFVPWYAILGNHDYRGNYQAEIDYTNVSQRWNMPAQYYVKEKSEDDVTVKLVFIDTNPYEDGYYTQEKYKAIWGQDSTKQLHWMDSVLADNTADWKIVVGHHPLYSGGKRLNDTQNVRGHLEKVLKKHEVDVYFAGHEHDLQHIQNPSYKTHHIISGAGSEVRPTAKMEYSLFAASIQGFVAASATREQLLLQFISYEGEVIYRYNIKKQVK